MLLERPVRMSFEAVVREEIARESGPDAQMGGKQSMLDDQPSPRLAPYLRVCAWCARRGAVPHGLRPSDPATEQRLNELYTA